MNIHRELKTMQKEQSLIQKELKEAQNSLKEYKNRDTEEEKSVKKQNEKQRQSDIKELRARIKQNSLVIGQKSQQYEQKVEELQNESRVLKLSIKCKEDEIKGLRVLEQQDKEIRLNRAYKKQLEDFKTEQEKDKRRFNDVLKELRDLKETVDEVSESQKRDFTLPVEDFKFSPLQKTVLMKFKNETPESLRNSVDIFAKHGSFSQDCLSELAESCKKDVNVVKIYALIVEGAQIQKKLVGSFDMLWSVLNPKEEVQEVQQ